MISNRKTQQEEKRKAASVSLLEGESERKVKNKILRRIGKCIDRVRGGCGVQFFCRSQKIKNSQITK